MKWYIGRCNNDECENGFVLGEDGELELCPECRGYEWIPKKLEGVLLLFPQEMTPLFHSKKECNEHIARTK
ncbi:MAG: hypothetical protein ABFD82_00660 [Syntrophaceae bacterium]